jgi:hypothetical protein
MIPSPLYVNLSGKKTMYANHNDAIKQTIKEHVDIYIQYLIGTDGFYISHEETNVSTAKNKLPGIPKLSKQDRYAYDVAELAEIYLGWK